MFMGLFLRGSGLILETMTSLQKPMKFTRKRKKKGWLDFLINHKIYIVQHINVRSDKMGAITLKKIHEDLMGIKKELEHIKTLVEEDFELSESVLRDIEESRKRPRKEFVSHEDMKKEFG